MILVDVLSISFKWSCIRKVMHACTILLWWIFVYHNQLKYFSGQSILIISILHCTWNNFYDLLNWFTLFQTDNELLKFLFCRSEDTLKKIIEKEERKIFNTQVGKRDLCWRKACGDSPHIAQNARPSAFADRDHTRTTKKSLR